MDGVVIQLKVVNTDLSSIFFNQYTWDQDPLPAVPRKAVAEVSKTGERWVGALMAEQIQWWTGMWLMLWVSFSLSLSLPLYLSLSVSSCVYLIFPTHLLLHVSNMSEVWLQNFFCPNQQKVKYRPRPNPYVWFALSWHSPLSAVSRQHGFSSSQIIDGIFRPIVQ